MHRYNNYTLSTSRSSTASISRMTASRTCAETRAACQFSASAVGKLTVRARRDLGDELGERRRALRAGFLCFLAGVLDESSFGLEMGGCWSSREGEGIPGQEEAEGRRA